MPFAFATTLTPFRSVVSQQRFQHCPYSLPHCLNRRFLQPFLTYTTKKFTSFGVNTESTYDWENHQWTVPLNVSVSQLCKIGKQPISLALGFKYYADGPSGGPDWGLRFAVTFLFPK